jgi:perosamine synthetase
MITIYEPNIKKYSQSAIKAIETGWISNHGEFVIKSTNKLKEVLNVKHVILMANGTCATHCLFLAIKHKYPEINKIYVPNNCYIAAWNSVLMEYSKENIEVMKMDINTWNICVNENYIKTLDTNSAVLIVHNLGNIINVPRLKRIRPDLIFVEDNCEGFTGKYEGIYSGTSEASLCSSVSFYGNKIITTGEGGAFMTNDDDIYNYIIKAYSQGMSEERYIHDTHAYNYRMTNIQAAFLYDQLNDLENILSTKKQVFENYKKLLSPLIDSNKVALFQDEENTESANWIFGIRLIDNNLSIKDTFNYFKENNVDIRPFFYPINKHKHLSDVIFGDDEIPLKLNREIIMIPSSPNITLENQKYIIDIITNVSDAYEIIEINKQNINLLEEFLKNKLQDTFRYFNKRNIDVINNHILTVLLKINKKIVGYGHIDNDNGKNWLGICLLEEYTKYGYGDKIINYMLGHKSVIESKPIYLSVDNNNYNAIKLYEKHNFKIIEKSILYSFFKLN